MFSSANKVLNSEERPEMLWPAAAQARRNSGVSERKATNLGFYLANRGYDVFLANSRGNIYCRRHLHLSLANPRFWEFSLDKKIDYDPPATLQFLRQLTDRAKLA